MVHSNCLRHLDFSHPYECNHYSVIFIAFVIVRNNSVIDNILLYMELYLHVTACCLEIDSMDLEVALHWMLTRTIPWIQPNTVILCCERHDSSIFNTPVRQTLISALSKGLGDTSLSTLKFHRSRRRLIFDGWSGKIGLVPCERDFGERGSSLTQTDQPKTLSVVKLVPPNSLARWTFIKSIWMSTIHNLLC